MWLYFLGIAKTSCSSFILPQEAFFFHCLLLLEQFNSGRIFLFQAPGTPVNQPCCGWQRKRTAISGVYRPAASSFSQEEMTMEFFNSAVEVLQTLVIALGAGL